MERIGQPIRLAAVFTPEQRIKPVWFDWRNRQYRIREVCYSWQEKTGDTLLLHFSVHDGEALYELVFNAKEQVWILAGREFR